MMLTMAMFLINLNRVDKLFCCCCACSCSCYCTVQYHITTHRNFFDYWAFTLRIFEYGSLLLLRAPFTAAQSLQVGAQAASGRHHILGVDQGTAARLLISVAICNRLYVIYIYRYCTVYRVSQTSVMKQTSTKLCTTFRTFYYYFDEESSVCLSFFHVAAARTITLNDMKNYQGLPIIYSNKIH